MNGWKDCLEYFTALFGRDMTQGLALKGFPVMSEILAMLTTCRIAGRKDKNGAPHFKLRE